MFIYKGGQAVTGGTYWESEKNEKVVLEAGGNLPGSGKVYYFKLPESYLLIPMVLLGLGLSMAIPYGIGFVVFIGVTALMGAVYAAGSASYRVMKEMLGRTATFGYAPTTAYLAGKKTKKAKREDGSLDEEQTQDQ